MTYFMYGMALIGCGVFMGVASCLVWYFVTGSKEGGSDEAGF
jgi:hypothetical protein